MYEMFQNIHIFHWLNRRGSTLGHVFEHMNFTEMLFGISFLSITFQHNKTIV